MDRSNALRSEIVEFFIEFWVIDLGVQHFVCLPEIAFEKFVVGSCEVVDLNRWSSDANRAFN